MDSTDTVRSKLSPTEQAPALLVAHPGVTARAKRGLEASISGALQRPALWLLAVVGCSMAIRTAIAIRVPAPWILPDEIVYSELAKSIADGERPSIRGIPVFGWGEVYPAVIAPAWMVFDDPMTAYRAALVTNALVMSLAAVPAYLLARMFVSRKSSLVVAVATALVPSLAYTGVLMTENAFYPLFLTSVWLIARAVWQPTLVNQAIAVGGLGLVAFTRIQGGALVAAYVAAVALQALTGVPGKRLAYLRRFAPSAALAVAAALTPLVASVARGNGPFGWLGSRSGTFDGFEPHEVPQWFAFLVADLYLYVAVAPVLATVIVVWRGLAGTSRESTRLFSSVTLPVLLAMLISVSFVSASLDVDGTENLNERYVFYVVPLLFIGLALWVREGLPRPRPWASLLLVASCVVTALLPIPRLGYSAGFQTLALLPWLSLDARASFVAMLVLVFTLACGGLWLMSRADRTGYIWLVTGLWMAVIGVAAVLSNANSADNSATAISGRSANWVDESVPDGAEVAVLWKQGREGRATPAEFRLMVTEFFNPSIGDVYRIGRPTYYETFLPTLPVVLQPDGGVADRAGQRIAPRYVLVTCRTPVVGRVLARSPLGSFDLVEVERPFRVLAGTNCDA